MLFFYRLVKGALGTRVEVKGTVWNFGNGPHLQVSQSVVEVWRLFANARQANASQ